MLVYLFLSLYFHVIFRLENSVFLAQLNEKEKNDIRTKKNDTSNLWFQWESQLKEVEGIPVESFLLKAERKLRLRTEYVFMYYHLNFMGRRKSSVIIVQYLRFLMILMMKERKMKDFMMKMIIMKIDQVKSISLY